MRLWRWTRWPARHWPGNFFRTYRVSPRPGAGVSARPAQLGTVRWPDGHAETDRPLQFVGVGHFGQVQRDVEKLPRYGMNVIQVELGPRSVVVGENAIETQVIDKHLALLDRCPIGRGRHSAPLAALLSRMGPQEVAALRNAEGGFLHYDIHAPEARAVLDKFLRTIVPRIGHHPALHSICLSNEPLFLDGRKSRYVQSKWHAWLRQRHGTLETLNQRGAVTMASSTRFRSRRRSSAKNPIHYDFITFNCEAFAEWHAWMASIIRELAPDIPLHAKVMICPNLSRIVQGPWSIAPELFAELSDFNGNDAWKYSSPGRWASDWQQEQMGYDFQRSMADKPVLNSENHLIPDRNLDFVSPSHIRNVFWQGAVHGQGATATWVWERTYDPASDLSGSILHRPACAEAMGQSGLELMRLAPELTTFQRVHAQVALLYSTASVVAGEDHLKAMRHIYEGLNFCGLRIGFVTERQLAAYTQTGELPAPLATCG